MTEQQAADMLQQLQQLRTLLHLVTELVWWLLEMMRLVLMAGVVCGVVWFIRANSRAV